MYIEPRLNQEQYSFQDTPRLGQSMQDYEIPAFITQINDLPPDQNTKTEMPGLEELSMNVFYQRMNNLWGLEERDRHNFIKSNIDLISNQILDGSCKYYRKLLEPVFLSVYKDVLSSMPATVIRTAAANMLAYSYRYMRNQDTTTIRAFRDISLIVNRRAIQLLCGVGVDADIACDLATARFSSMDEMVNVNRLNYEIYRNGSQTMTLQTIIWIYEQLFDQMRYLFSATMLESKDTMKPNETCKVTGEDFYEVFSQVSLALLTIVNNMPMESIDQLIHIFVETWVSAGSPMTRFSLRALSADYGRIRHVVEVIETKDSIFVP